MWAWEIFNEGPSIAIQGLVRAKMTKVMKRRGVVNAYSVLFRAVLCEYKFQSSDSQTRLLCIVPAALINPLKIINFQFQRL